VIRAVTINSTGERNMENASESDSSRFWIRRKNTKFQLFL
jgi:hypothetical protein